MSEFGPVWDYHRDFDIMHFGNPEAVLRDEEKTWPPPPAPDEDAFEHVNKPKKARFLRQPKGWFRT